MINGLDKGSDNIKKFSIISLGCFKNLVDSEAIMGQFIEKGYYFTEDLDDAEIIIINTCGFINPARTESIKAIKEAALRKRKGNCKKLIVIGCLVQRDKEKLKKNISEIDFLVGIDDIPKITNLLEQKEISDYNDINRIPKWIYDGEGPRVLTGRSHYSFIKIAEGCNHKCSFCIIPHLKGMYRSRSIESIIKEAQGLARSAVKELILISQDTSFYGRDQGRFDILDLLKKLIKIKEFQWIRLLYLHPDHINGELINIISNEEKICKYFDLPFQHCNEKILKLMKRGGNKEKYLQLINEIREKIPEASIRTSLIVGFPGEGAREFDELLQFCREAQFDNLGVFIYYDEREAESYSLPLKIPYKEKILRKREILALQRELLLKKNREIIGKIFTCLIDERKGNKFQLRHQGMAPEIDSIIVAGARDEYEVGDFVPVKITGARVYQFYGVIN